MSENKEEKSKQLTRIVCEFCVRGHMTLFNFYNGLLRGGEHCHPHFMDFE